MQKEEEEEEEEAAAAATAKVTAEKDSRNIFKFKVSIFFPFFLIFFLIFEYKYIKRTKFLTKKKRRIER